MEKSDAEILAQDETGLGLQMSGDLAKRLRFAETWDLDADQHARDRCGVLMLEAAEKLEKIQAELEEAQTIDAGLWKWLGERELQPDGDSFEWGDVLNALRQYEMDASTTANRLLDAVEAFFAEHDSATKAIIAMGGPGTRLKDSPSVATLRRVASSMTVKADEQ